MIKTDLSEGQEWIAARGFNNSFTLTFTLSGSAYNISSFTFGLKIRRIGGTTDLLSIAQGSGITNGGASGIATIQLTKAQTETIDADSYFYQIEYTVAGLTYRLLHGTLNLVTQYDENEINPSISIPVNLAGTDVNLDVTLGLGLNITRVQSVASAATVTANADTDDLVVITGQSQALMLANPSGTPGEGQGMVIRIKDNGTARAISYGNQYRAIGVTLPTTTVINKTVYLAMAFNDEDDKWDVLGVAQEG